ncbi:MAG: hypothetical protein ACAI35_19895 [Candidatus Methylacidiphilales bacterium]|nr:hypothetical protein [Candidatus Methylacidiphilales bacterium]
MNFSKRSFTCALALLTLPCLSVSYGQDTTAPATTPAPETAAAPAPAKPKGNFKDDGAIMGLAKANANQVAKFEEELGLSDEQKGKLKTALDTYRNAIDGLKNDNGITAQDKKAKGGEAAKTLVSTVGEILTPEQKEKLGQLRKEKAEKAAAAKKAKQEEKEKQAEEKKKKKEEDKK